MVSMAMIIIGMLLKKKMEIIMQQGIQFITIRVVQAVVQKIIHLNQTIMVQMEVVVQITILAVINQVIIMKLIHQNKQYLKVMTIL